MTPYIIGIRFIKVGKVYHFDASQYSHLQVGDYAIVDTSRGKQLGEIVAIINDDAASPEGMCKQIVRPATPRDLVLRQIWKRKETEAVINCRAKTAELGFKGVKIVSAEFSFDGDKLIILYSCESENKTDIKKLRASMRRVYTRSRVEMRQIGPRDVAKYIGGMGACGLEARCCSMFLDEFNPISIKMAKEQGISLTPSEITGMCGRLRCCLVYEYNTYTQTRRGLPKRGKRIPTPLGEGKVLDANLLKNTITVELENGNTQEFAIADLENGVGDNNNPENSP
jgi:cell fate regulator YaaT (PSP1 superfamily)